MKLISLKLHELDGGAFVVAHYNVRLARLSHVFHQEFDAKEKDRDCRSKQENEDQSLVVTSTLQIRFSIHCFDFKKDAGEEDDEKQEACGWIEAGGGRKKKPN
jgi:hypothetical protein